MQQKRVLIIAGSPRPKGNSQALCEAFRDGAEKSGHHVDLIRLQDKRIGFCMACDGCMRNGGTCVQKDDMEDILSLYQKADVLVLDSVVTR